MGSAFIPMPLRKGKLVIYSFFVLPANTKPMADNDAHHEGERAFYDPTDSIIQLLDVTIAVRAVFSVAVVIIIISVIACRLRCESAARCVCGQRGRWWRRWRDRSVAGVGRHRFTAVLKVCCRLGPGAGFA
jgi:hypothetical protein